MSKTNGHIGFLAATPWKHLNCVLINKIAVNNIAVNNLNVFEFRLHVALASTSGEKVSCLHSIVSVRPLAGCRRASLCCNRFISKGFLHFVWVYWIKNHKTLANRAGGTLRSAALRGVNAGELEAFRMIRLWSYTSFGVQLSWCLISCLECPSALQFPQSFPLRRVSCTPSLQQGCFVELHKAVQD